MEEQISVLIVEDSQVQAALLTRILQGRGYQTHWAKDGQEALEHLQGTLPTLVLSDIEMPNLDGYGLCRAIKGTARTATLPVVLLTNLSHPEDIIHGLNAGADSYLTKPVDREHLLSRIETLLRWGARPSVPIAEPGLEIQLGGHKHTITSGREQILTLLLSTFEDAVQQNAELIRVNRELAEAQARLTERNARLEQLNLQKNVLLGMAAHDLRNPLSTVLGYSRFLLSKPDEVGPQAQKYISNIEGSTTFMLALVEDLLDVSALESGQLNLSPQVADVCGLLQNAVELLRPLAQDKQIELRLSLPPDPARCKVDPTKLDQVHSNLLSNAIKYSPHGSVVDVSMVLEQGDVLVKVKDQGPGIATSEQNRLFQPFGRTSARSTGGEKSTGLGLAIARRIVEGHQGNLGVISQPGEGSTFWYSLPLV